MPGLRASRRRFLTAAGAASIVGIAGCSGGGDGGSTPTATATPNQEALEHYGTAVETLIETNGTLDEWADSSFESDRVGALQNRVSSAREELAAAEEAADPSGELAPRIAQATLVADFQALSLAYYEAVNVFFQVVSRASEFAGNELHQRAADTYAESQGVLEDARQVVEDMGTILSNIDNETLGEPELEYTGEPLDHLDLADMGAIDAAESYALANENLHLAFVQFEVGNEHSENEEFAEAKADWETGRTHAEEALAAFEAAVDNQYTPENIRQDSIAKLGAAETLIDAFDKFIQAASAAEAGNQAEASELFNEGLDILSEL